MTGWVDARTKHTHAPHHGPAAQLGKVVLDGHCQWLQVPLQVQPKHMERLDDLPIQAFPYLTVCTARSLEQRNGSVH